MDFLLCEELRDCVLLLLHLPRMRDPLHGGDGFSARSWGERALVLSQRIPFDAPF
jgi:hypothetical protein